MITREKIYLVSITPHTRMPVPPVSSCLPQGSRTGNVPLPGTEGELSFGYPRPPHPSTLPPYTTCPKLMHPSPSGYSRFTTTSSPAARTSPMIVSRIARL